MANDGRGRRNFLKLLGGGVVLAAGGGGLWAATRDPAAARKPWEAAGEGRNDARLTALSYALLAPNPHNRQPWLADLTGNDTVTLYCEPERRLPETDPFDRQITIGLGCFIELFVMAAAEHGFATEVQLFPEGEPQPRLDRRPVATLRLVSDPAIRPDPLFAHVLDRRSNKEAYDTSRPVADEALAAIAKAARSVRVAHTDDAGKVAALRSLAWAAMETELLTPEALKESVDLMRIGRAEIEANPDGIDLSGPLMEGLKLAGLLTREALLDPQSTAFRQQMPVLKEPFDTAVAFMWTTTAGNRRADQIAAGRDHLRLNLAATARGIAMQPLSQALQEYAEMKPHHEGMRAELGIGADETLQMLVRLGYGPAIKASPRWPLETRIGSA
ncbi:twin-arginine translocation pathway signal protein [Nitratireductor mangrovi]|uniref:Twin-arginine translocation pathway signal protein n=1 Tax=Nitratireductor mangrovi TaxID=2599600 RepID=A0A5B8KUK5_9HYPH|nr:twin-arginine translocation pathway signal protein [Nitratireductor mangrovi]QDY99281.1 twin-arginine translocation pathway signal protein [Nitratireductor mangrovi]